MILKPARFDFVTTSSKEPNSNKKEPCGAITLKNGKIEFSKRMHKLPLEKREAIEKIFLDFYQQLKNEIKDL